MFQAFIPLIKKRFKEPLFKIMTNKRDKKDDSKETMQSQHDTFNENFKRPSDYRRASIQLQREDFYHEKTTDRKLKISITSEDGNVMPKGASGDTSDDKFLTTGTPTKDSLLTDLNNLVETFVW